MPCYTVNTISVEFDPQNYGVLAEVVRGMGGSMQRNGKMATVVINSQTVSLNDKQATGPASAVNQLRVAYAQGIVGKAKQFAKEKDWNVQSFSENRTVISKAR